MCHLPPYRPKPPRLATRFLRWYCHSDLLDEVEGDLHELFQRRVETNGLQSAQLLYWLNVLMFLHPNYIRKRKYYPTNHTAMLRHNFLIAFQQAFGVTEARFFINLIGLVLRTWLVPLLIFLWVNDELRVDKFHEQDSQLYQILENVQQAGDTITRQTTAGPTAEALTEEMPEVALAATATIARLTNATLSVNNNDLKAEGIYASADYFNLFSYDLVQGDKDQVLFDKKSIVISESLAASLFDATENVIGKVIEWQHDKQYQVSGVFSNVPSNSSIQFDWVLTFEEFKDENEWATSWGNTAPQTYVLLREGTDVEQFNQKIADLGGGGGGGQNQNGGKCRPSYSIRCPLFGKIPPQSVREWSAGGGPNRIRSLILHHCTVYPTHCLHQFHEPVYGPSVPKNQGGGG